MFSSYYPFEEGPQMSIHSLYIKSSMHACEFYYYHYWQFCYKIARSAGNRKSLLRIIRLRLIVTLTHLLLNMVLIYQIYVIFG